MAIKCHFCGDSGYAVRYGIEEACKNCDIHKQKGGGIIKKLTVTTDAEREQWIEMLKLAANYHYDMAGQFQPEILGDTEMEEVVKIHRAWGKAIQEATDLISFWELEENDEIRTPPAYNITKEIEDAESK